MINKYTYELHSHTAESSGCANVFAAESYALHESAGFDGMVITDHFVPDWNGKFGSTHEEQAENYAKGYYNAKAVAREGFTVMFGLEFRFCNGPEEYLGNDYLVFGITPEMLRAEKNIGSYDRGQFREFADRNGLLVIQAHPFRSMCNPDRTPGFLDGVEVYNGHPGHDSKNDLALEFGKEVGGIMTSGSDFHEKHMLARGGIATDFPIRSERELVEVLKSGLFQLMRAE